MEQTLEKKIEEIHEKEATEHTMLGGLFFAKEHQPQLYKALAIFIEQEKRQAFEAGRKIVNHTLEEAKEEIEKYFEEFEYPTYESYSLKKGEEETERGLG